MKFLWFFLLFPLNVLAQQPSYYTIGERELEGEHIYDIYQAKNGIYWITTNTGLVRYDGYTFDKKDCIGNLTSSLFNLVEDYTGTIYCHNLAGQVFKIEDDECGLHYTIPDSLFYGMANLQVDNLNQLVIAAQRVIVLNKDGNSRVIVPEQAPIEYYLGNLIKLPDSSLTGSPSPNGLMFSWKNNRMAYSHVQPLPNPETDMYNVLEFQGKALVSEVWQGRIMDFGNEGLIPLVDSDLIDSKGQNLRVYTTQNSLWMAGSTTGLFQFDENLQVTNGGKPIFPESFISDVHEDLEKNILLGTFGNGIMVVLEHSAIDFTGLPIGDKAISIASTPNGVIYLGMQSGHIIKVEEGQFTSTFRKSEVTPVEQLYYLSNNSLLITEKNAATIDLETREENPFLIGALKDICMIEDGKYLTASGRGASVLDSDKGISTPIKTLDFRLSCIGRNHATKTIYAGSSKGLILQQGGENVFFELDEKSVQASDVEALGNTVFIATGGQGILVFKQDKLVEVWNKETGLISDQITQIMLAQDRMFLASDQGMQILDLDGSLVKTISRSEGLYANNIQEFDLVGDELWVIHDRGVQHINLKNLAPFSFEPTLQISNLSVNDSVSVNLDQTRFKSDETSFSFHLRVPNLRYQNEIEYEYMLEGADPDWQRNAFSENIIKYRSLSPGDYTFTAKAICRDAESEEITYSFTIATPFYMAWWFYALVSLGLILAVVLWFRSRLKRHAFLSQQQNELNASKLTAIQSQMNPHFIFNALNSIQGLVLKGDVTNSYTYITKFADLVRRTLNYSDKDFIDFENELKLIELYLTLEKLRFNTDFEFTIDASGVEDIQLPPMLIQPFIENALVHGLLHREGSKKLDLKFELNDHLVCTITDNGVGRKKAREIKERQRSGHESFSVNAIKKRFEILDRNFGGNLGFTTEDLEEDGNPIGTCVKLVIPVKRKF